MNSLRIEGQKTVSIEIVQQFDWEVPDVDCARRKFGQHCRFRKRISHDEGIGLDK